MSSKKNKNTTVLVIVLLLITIILALKSYNDYKNLQKNAVYVIGKIENTEGVKSGIKVHYIFNYLGRKYSGDYISNKLNKNAIGKRYFFKINSEKPGGYMQVQELMYVPDSLTSPPAGWKNIPQ